MSEFVRHIQTTARTNKKRGTNTRKGTVKVQVPQNARDHGYTWIALDSNNSRLDDLPSSKGGGKGWKRTRRCGIRWSDGYYSMHTRTHAYTHTHSLALEHTSKQARRYSRK